MKYLIKENKGECYIFITLVVFLLINSIIDKITHLQIAGFFLILLSGVLRLIIFNKTKKATIIQTNNIRSY